MSPAGVTIGMRLDAKLLAQLDAYIEDVRHLTGIQVSRAAAARRLVELGLEQVGRQRRPRGRGR